MGSLQVFVVLAVLAVLVAFVPAGDVEGREIKCRLWMVARPVTCAPQPPKLTWARQLTGLAATIHRPDARARAPDGDFCLFEEEEKVPMVDSASESAIELPVGIARQTHEWPGALARAIRATERQRNDAGAIRGDSRPRRHAIGCGCLAA